MKLWRKWAEIYGEGLGVRFPGEIRSARNERGRPFLDGDL